VRGSFTAPKEDNTWYTARDNRETRAMFVQYGAFAGSICLISLPTIQVTDCQPAPADTNIAGNVVTVEGRHDEAIGGVTELGYSAFRVSFL
jgi:hypothetical protein